MSIEFLCQGCQRTLVVPDEFAGKRASCPECGAIGQIPVPAPALTPAPTDNAPVPTNESTATSPESVESRAADSSIPAPDRPPSTPPLHPPVDSQVAPVESAASVESATLAESVTPAEPSVPVELVESSASAAAPSPAAKPASARPPLPNGRYFLRTPEGKSYGPVGVAELEDWVRAGRVSAECDIKREEEVLWQAADQLFPALSPWRQPAAPAALRRPQDVPRASIASASGQNDALAAGGGSALGAASPLDPASRGPAGALLPDRGILILSLGIVGVFAPCPVFSLMAWVMGTADLQEIRVGRMDPQGLSPTQWGRLLGMLVSLVWVGIALFGTALSLYWAAS